MELGGLARSSQELSRGFQKAFHSRCFLFYQTLTVCRSTREPTLFGGAVALRLWVLGMLSLPCPLASVRCVRVGQLHESAGPWLSEVHPQTWVHHCAPAGDSACPVHPRRSLVYPLLFHCQDKGRCAGTVSPMGFPSGSYELGSHPTTEPARFRSRRANFPETSVRALLNPTGPAEKDSADGALTQGKRRPFRVTHTHRKI